MTFVPEMLTANTPEWETPQELFDSLDAEFHFDLDPCCTHENAKCELHYTKAEDGLKQDWTGHRVYCNPPYGRQIKKWVEKAAKSKCLTVMLIPARTDTKWFHDYIYGSGGGRGSVHKRPHSFQRHETERTISEHDCHF